MLIDRGADINSLDYLNRTPTHYAAKDNINAEVLKLLIDKGADI